MARLVEMRCPGVVEEIDPLEAARHFPPLGPVRRALFNAAGRRVDGRALNAALRHAAVSRGLRVLGVRSYRPRARHRRQDVVTAVVTGEGSVPTGAVALAGGAWTAELADTLGVDIPVGSPQGADRPSVASGARTASAWPIVQPVLGYYLVPWPDGRVACGGTMEAEAGFDHRPTADGVHQLLRECLRTAPGLAQATVVETRVGSRPATPDGRPIVGRVPGWRNAYVATGHGAEGLLLGPYSAAIVARALLGVEAARNRPSVPWRHALLGLYAPERFA